MFDLSKILLGLIIITAVVVFVFGVISSGITGSVSYDQGYKQGQIDALSGIVKYEQIEKTEVEWKVKE